MRKEDLLAFRLIGWGEWAQFACGRGRVRERGFCLGAMQCGKIQKSYMGKIQIENRAHKKAIIF